MCIDSYGKVPFGLIVQKATSKHSAGEINPVDSSLPPDPAPWPFLETWNLF